MSLFGTILSTVGGIAKAFIGRPRPTRGLSAPVFTQRLRAQLRPLIPRGPGVAPFPIPIPFGRAKPKRRRRKRARFTQKEIQELLMAKMLFGARSPIVTILGIKMLGRGD